MPALRASLVAAALLATTLVLAPAASAAPTLTNGCIDSVPEPASTDPVKICFSLYRPVGADGEHPVPMVFHSHGWGGSRTNDPTAFGDWLAAGFGILSFDQRGFGESGG